MSPRPAAVRVTVTPCPDEREERRAALACVSFVAALGALALYGLTALAVGGVL